MISAAPPAAPPAAQASSPHLPSFGFVIDNRKCIGCHACSVACKSENEVPLGVNRTWVKYVETGRFPHTRRHFQVTRCNHCANPPCVRICPTEAMYQREDGIVEFDPAVCIGCKACLQACPYDAIYVDPDTGTAAKCHYCAHRTDIGLAPACVVVCPEEAIIAGDMNDPESTISRLLAREKVTVRKPEQGTAPKLFYIDGNEATLHPTATERAPETFMWADVIPLAGRPDRSGRVADGAPAATTRAPGPGQRPPAGPGSGRRQPQAQGKPAGGPIEFGQSVAEHMVQVSYNAQHQVPWHWPVPAYLVTKGIGAGLFLILALGWLLDWFPFDIRLAIAGGTITLAALGLTTGLLVFDLERPGRFLYILRRPQWRSWLARGAVILMAFSALTLFWWLLEVSGLVFDYESRFMRTLYLWLGLPLAILTAIYTAFLFAQAEGRDLWQSPLLSFHLLTQAFLAGAAALLILDLVQPLSSPVAATVSRLMILFLLLDLFLMLMGEFGLPHASEVAARAAHEISHGRYRDAFWYGVIGLGRVIPLGLLLAEVLLGRAQWVGASAGLAALIGLYVFEYVFVMAPQEVPNS